MEEGRRYGGEKEIWRREGDMEERRRYEGEKEIWRREEDKAERWRCGIENKIWRKEDTWKSERNIEERIRYGREMGYR